MPFGSSPNGGGQLCYETAAACVSGPNSCGASEPCSLRVATCSTGAVSSLGWHYFCDSSMPFGAIPNGAGQLCFNSTDACLLAPNGCSTSNGYDCVNNTALCSTGQAGGSGSYAVCEQDIPPGAIANGAGSWCYDSPESCAQGTNGCNSAQPCVLSVADCATGLATNQGHSYFCTTDVPAGSMPNGAGGASDPPAAARARA